MEIIINLKTYNDYKKNLEIVKVVSKYREAIICSPVSDIGMLALKTKLRVYGQHVDFHSKGRNTGYVVVENLKGVGCRGVLINHSEHPIRFEVLKKTIKRCNDVGLKTLVCVKSLSEAKKVMKLNIDMLAYEEPKLISSGKSITDVNTGKIKEFVRLLKGRKVIAVCGAGISSCEDIKEAEALGCKGVLISSAVAKATKKRIKELLR